MNKIPDAAMLAALCGYKGHTTHGSALRGALTAALPHLPLGFEVKQLEWEFLSGDYYAQGCGTQYNVYSSRPNRWNAVTTSPKNIRLVTNGTLEEAKSAAQADFERRVRECHVGVEAQGWLYFNEDTGTEYSKDHPVISGECPDAQDILPATPDNLLKELLSSWKSWAEDRQEIMNLRDSFVDNKVDVAAVYREAIEKISKLTGIWDVIGSEALSISKRALSVKPAQGSYSHADELRDLHQSILQCKTLADFNAVKKTVEALPAAPTSEANK